MVDSSNFIDGWWLVRHLVKGFFNWENAEDRKKGESWPSWPQALSGHYHWREEDAKNWMYMMDNRGVALSPSILSAIATDKNLEPISSESPIIWTQSC